MILQALAEYYDRKRATDPGSLPERGFEWREIPFVIVLSDEGKFVNLEDTRDAEAGRKKGRTFTVPKAEKRASNILANLLWDKPDYALGYVPEGKKPDRIAKQHESFCAKIEALFGTQPDDIGVRALLAFLRRGDFDTVWAHPVWEEVAAATGPYIAFRLNGETRLINERPDVVRAIRDSVGDDEAPRAQCLVTGAEAPIAALHPAIKGVRGAQSMGANIVSFNLSAFRTHGREQGANAPISEGAAFAYTTALNALLDRDAATNAHVGGTTVVFWAERGNEVEDLAGALFRDDQKVLDDPDRGVERIRGVYRAPEQGARVSGDSDERFYVLGLAPNAARLSVRFWRPTTVEDFAAAVLRHFDDIEVVRPPWAARYPSVRALLRSVAVLGKDDNIPPNLAGSMLDSILSEQPYPRHLLGAAIQRNRAEQDVTPDRAAVIKGCLVRAAMNSPQDRETRVALDEANENIGYRLGRLFAALERVQERASPGIQSGIRERYYSSASATPTAAFPTLIKLKNHHLAKMENRGEVVNLERLLGAILDGIEDFPAVLSLADQGRFALGYYHQRQSFFTKSDETKEVSHA